MSVFTFLGTTQCQICPPRNSTPVRLFCRLVFNCTTPFATAQLLLKCSSTTQLLLKCSSTTQLLLKCSSLVTAQLLLVCKKVNTWVKFRSSHSQFFLVCKNLKTWVKFHPRPPLQRTKCLKFTVKIRPFFLG